jgi:hypothetical protein
MTHPLTIPDPKVVVGIALMVLGGWLALEGSVMWSVGQLFIAAAFISLGWLLRKRGVEALMGAGLKRWLRFSTVAFPIFLGVYVLGYFALMDRHRPTSPAGAFVRFESSFRFAPREWVHKAQTPYETPWGKVTSWNIIYQPMDRLLFQRFPRSQQEREKLRGIGYYG